MGCFSHPTARPQLDLKPPPFTSSDADPTETSFLWDFLNALGRHRTSENPVLLSLKGKHPAAILALADGTLWQGQSIGAPGTTVGEVVFNTAITGYQEILTDPSYCQQLVTLTYPHIGNVGTNDEDIETVNWAASTGVRGCIMQAAVTEPQNFRATKHLDQWLKARGIVPALLEQWLAKDDLAGARALAEESGWLVAADESVTSADDARRVVAERAAGAINIKLMKGGVAAALDIVAVAKSAGLTLMIGGNVESILAMTGSACFAAGQGGFDFADLDTPLFLAENPFDGGFTMDGGEISVAHLAAGHGVTPKR